MDNDVSLGMFTSNPAERKKKPMERTTEAQEKKIQERFKPHKTVENIVEGTRIRYRVWDFRTPDNQANTDLFLDGVGQGERMYALPIAMVMEAKARHSLLIIPTIPEIPPVLDEASLKEAKFDTSIDARLIWKGIDVCKADWSGGVRIAGFSDGNRNALEMAKIIDEQVALQESTKRELVLFSTVGVVNMHKKSENANGRKILGGFIRELINMSVTETAARYNAEVLKNNGKNEIVAKGLTPMPAVEDIGKRAGLLTAKLLKLISFPEGRKVFGEQLKLSNDENLKFLEEIITRLTSATSIDHLFKHLSKNEVRSQACEGLKTFDVKMALPKRDVLSGIENIGRFLKEKGDIHGEKSNREVGMDFLNGKLNLQRAGRSYFPSAKSVHLSLVGNDNSHSFLWTHLGPMMNPGYFMHEALKQDEHENRH